MSDKVREFLKDKPDPLIGYMCEPDFEEDGPDGEWDAMISSRNPKGANLAWLNPIPMIEKSHHDRIVKELQDQIDQWTTNYQMETENLTAKVQQFEAENEGLQCQIQDLKNTSQTEALRALREIDKTKLQRLESVIEEIREIGETNQSWKLVFESLDRGKELKG